MNHQFSVKISTKITCGEDPGKLCVRSQYKLCATLGDINALSNNNRASGDASYVSCFKACTNCGKTSANSSFVNDFIQFTAHRRTSMSGKLKITINQNYYP